jgi:hypothetical protein
MQDGSPLIYNMHICGHDANPILFPASDTVLPDQYAKLLFNCSSKLPPHVLKFIQEYEYMEIQITAGAGGFVFNTDISIAVRVVSLNIYT